MKTLTLTTLLLISASAFAQDPVTPVQQAITANNQAATAMASALGAAQTLKTQNGSLQTQVTNLQAQIASLTVTPPPQGTVNYFELMQPAWDPYINSADPAVQAWIKGHLNMCGTYSPYFDPNLSWMPNCIAYVDTYAIYNPSALATQHPGWIARDVVGKALFIPWKCSAGTCPQYAGDISNPAFRAYMVSQVQALVATGYRGVFLDDVNMNMSTGNASGAFVAPKDPATGKAMTQAAWEAYMAAYLKQLRLAIPPFKIIQNSVWTAGSPGTDALILAQMQAADVISYERGFGDPGITGGQGQYSLGAYMAHMHDVHVIAKKSVNIMDYNVSNQAYSLACFFLIQEAGDSIGFMDETYANWDANKLYSVNLGTAKAPKFWNPDGLWERDYANGVVYVNEPGAMAKTIQVPSGLHYVGGASASQITLQPMQGVIFTNN